MSFDPKQKGYRIGAEEAGTLVAGPLATGQTPQGHGMAGVNDQAVEANHIVAEEDVANTLKSQDGRGWSYDPEATYVPALTTRAGDTQDDQQTGQLVSAVPISADAVRREGDAKTPSADAEGNVRLRDPGLGVGEPGDPAYTLSATDPGAVAAPLSHGSNPNSNAAGRRREDDENLAVFPTLGADYARQAGGHPGAEESADALSQAGASVRRLTPTECERLQALPDGWTQLGETADSRRYAALGDAVTGSVGRWIGERLILIDRR